MIVRRGDATTPEVTLSTSPVDPVASMQAVENLALAETAMKVREMLRQVIGEIG